MLTLYGGYHFSFGPEKTQELMLAFLCMGIEVLLFILTFFLMKKVSNIRRIKRIAQIAFLFWIATNCLLLFPFFEKQRIIVAIAVSLSNILLWPSLIQYYRQAEESDCVFLFISKAFKRVMKR